MSAERTGAPASFSGVPGPVVVAHARAEALRLAPCGVDPPADDAGLAVRMTEGPLSLRLPAGAARTEGAEGSGTWLLPDSGVVTLMVTELDGASYFIGGDAGSEVVPQDECAMRVAGQVSRVARYLLLHRGGADTVFVAVTDVPVRAGFWIVGGVIGRSEASRTAGMAALRTVSVAP